MKREAGSCNHLISFHERQRNWESHQRRIKKVQPTLHFSSKVISASTHVKKQPLAEFNRLFDINIQNKSLLKKITKKSPSKISWQKPFKLMKNNRKQYYEDYRQKKQNKEMLKRLKECKSDYKMQKFVAERRMTERYINSICKYGYKDYVPTKTVLKQNVDYTINLQAEKKSNQKQPKTEKLDEESWKQSECGYRKIQELLSERQVKIGKEILKVRGVIWENTITFQVDRKSDKGRYSVEIDKKTFFSKYEGELENLLKKIFTKKSV